MYGCVLILCLVAQIDMLMCWHKYPRWFGAWRFDEVLMKYLKPLPWKMLEPCLHWWRCEDLMFHVLIKPCVYVLYLDWSREKQAWRL